jgi:hypothetical protein
MSVIITHSPPATGDPGIFTQVEKLALELEMAYKTAFPSYYKEFDYVDTGPLKGSLIDIDIWTDDTKTTKLFHKDLWYNDDKLLDRTLLIRVSDSTGLLKIFEYDASDNLTSITVSAG